MSKSGYIAQKQEAKQPPVFIYFDIFVLLLQFILDFLPSYPPMIFSQKRIRMAAISTRVVVPAGFRPPQS